MNKKHIEKTIEYFAHDYRDMKLGKESLKDMLMLFVEALNCDHECTSNCRRVGCDCRCGNFHFQ